MKSCFPSGFGPCGQNLAEVDERIGNGAEPDPPFHPSLSLVTGAVQTMARIIS